MAMSRDHDLHLRRWSRNLGLGLTLAAFVALVFWLTIAKVQRGAELEGFDHGYRNNLVPDAEGAAAAPEASE